MEITSTRLDLLYKLVPDVAIAYKFKLSEPDTVLEDITFNNIHNVEQQFIDWAHNNIATELQGIIDDDDIVMEIRIWNKTKGE
jgi:NAD-dependent DNA ligase